MKTTNCILNEIARLMDNFTELSVQCSSEIKTDIIGTEKYLHDKEDFYYYQGGSEALNHIYAFIMDNNKMET